LLFFDSLKIDKLKAENNKLRLNQMPLEPCYRRDGKRFVRLS
jgi:hypothetical protein